MERSVIPALLSAESVAKKRDDVNTLLESMSQIPSMLSWPLPPGGSREFAPV